ncbi:hypothetical protein AMTRI_Chr02g213740 [Amborella trichopoda]
MHMEQVLWSTGACALSLLFCALALALMLLTGKRQSHLPPGPKGLPMVGSLHRLGSRPLEALAALAETHGSLMTLQLGFMTTVVVSSSEMAKEVLQKNDLVFGGRTVIEVLKMRSYPEGSLVWAQTGPRWRALRRICTTQLFTPQRLDSLQALRCQKVHEMVELIRQAEPAVDIGRAAFVTSMNIISNMIFSADMVNPNSGSAQEFRDVVWAIMEVAGAPNLADYFPMLKALDPQGLKGRCNKLFGRLHQFLNVKIDERLQSRERGGVDRGDFIDAILDSKQENGVDFSRSEILALLTVRHYPRLCYAENEKDLFVAGSDTSSTTVEWAMAELLRNPDKMAMANMELSRILGVVKETWRFHPPVPLLIPHRADATVNVAGYIVPKHTQVLINYWAIGRDPKVWDNPTAFLPERFLGCNVDYKGKDFQFIPFGAGRRICPGLPLGVRMVHLILASLLHYFDWGLPDGMKAEEMDMRDKFGVTLQKLVPLRVIPVQSS